MPGPQRGEIVRQIGEALREKITLLGKLVCIDLFTHAMFNLVCFMSQSAILSYAGFLSVLKLFWEWKYYFIFIKSAIVVFGHLQPKRKLFIKFWEIDKQHKMNHYVHIKSSISTIGYCLLFCMFSFGENLFQCFEIVCNIRW